MTAPLYNNCEKPSKCDKEGNHGLWFERFFDQYAGANWEVGTEKASWLSDHFNNKKVGDSKQLERHAQAQIQLAKNLQGQSDVFTASWHFVTGMGNPHPVENGFAWHPTLGVPYLTGAAVKGLIRSYIENNLDTDNPENPDKKELLLQWFGSTDKDPKNHTKEMPARAGELIFFDALPTKPVTLGVDIMTPHMGKWYEKGGTDQAAGTAEAVPADWHDPVPVSFLVAKDITLLFSFALRPYPDADKIHPEIDLADVVNVLNRALEYAGAGGKTATGYGGMQPKPDELARLEQASAKAAQDRAEAAKQAAEKAARDAALAKMNPIERKIAEFPTVLDAIKALESDEWQAEEQQQAAAFVKTRMQQEKCWKESPTGKNPDRDKDYKRTQTVMKFLQ